MSRARGSILNYLDAVRRRPGMYVGGEHPPGVVELRRLDTLLRGYLSAVHEHRVSDDYVVDFQNAFGSFLEKRSGLSMSLGPIEAVILEAERSDSNPWVLYFSLVDEFREQLDR